VKPLYMMRRVWMSLAQLRELFPALPPDPVRDCALYKADGCAHVDGFLCDFPQCSMLADWQAQREKLRYTEESSSLQG